ncbi:MAG: hypothetical protein R3B46_13630 [Phycisphaerales bacterium]
MRHGRLILGGAEPVFGLAQSVVDLVGGQFDEDVALFDHGSLGDEFCDARLAFDLGPDFRLVPRGEGAVGGGRDEEC